jgi:TatA/E family protein of Tat protein translocase
MGISGGEIFLIVLVILMLFGADKLPELVRSFGKGMHEIKKATDDIKREVTESVEDIKGEVFDVKQNMEREIHPSTVEIKDGIEGYEPYEQASNEAEQMSAGVDQSTSNHSLSNRNAGDGSGNARNGDTSD